MNVLRYVVWLNKNGIRHFFLDLQSAIRDLHSSCADLDPIDLLHLIDA